MYLLYVWPYINHYFNTVFLLFFLLSSGLIFSILFYFINLASSRCNFTKSASRRSLCGVLITVNNLYLNPFPPTNLKLSSPQNTFDTCNLKNWYLCLDTINFLKPFVAPREWGKPNQQSKYFNSEWWCKSRMLVSQDQVFFLPPS